MFKEMPEFIGRYYEQTLAHRAASGGAWQVLRPENRGRPDQYLDPHRRKAARGSGAAHVRAGPTRRTSRCLTLQWRAMPHPVRQPHECRPASTTRCGFIAPFRARRMAALQQDSPSAQTARGLTRRPHLQAGQHACRVRRAGRRLARAQGKAAGITGGLKSSRRVRRARLRSRVRVSRRAVPPRVATRTTASTSARPTESE